MSFAVKLDENLSLAHVDLLRHAGYDADRSIIKDCQGQRTSKYGNAFVLTIASSSPSISTFPTYADIRQAPIPVSF
jgi:hypothetical protein